MLTPRRAIRTPRECLPSSERLNYHSQEPIPNLGAAAMPDSEVKFKERMQVGLARLREHWLNQAEIAFREALQLKPDDPEALHGMGVTLCKLQRGEEGIALILRSTELNPKNLLGRIDLAVALRDAGRSAEADAAHQRAAKALVEAGQAQLAPLVEQCFSAERGHFDVRVVDYRYRLEVRYGGGRPPHPRLAAQIGARRNEYLNLLAEMAACHENFSRISLEGDYANAEPFWLNTWFPPLDAMSLWAILRRSNPEQFVEIGSGMSTKFARRAVVEFGLRTKLVSIDPQPRNIIDSLCDQIIRRPLEQCSLDSFEQMRPGSILFLDSSHRTFQGSDVTVFFLDILPRLQPGVLVHIHDIYLPYDYPSGHLPRMWNEQYMLATALLFGGSGFEIVFPGWFVERDSELAGRRDDLLRRGPLQDLSLHGASFWMRKL
jgi:tetratricopeptide (TPR) repeat protein